MSISYKKFFELSPDPLCIAKPDGYFQEVNQAFTDCLGYTMKELTASPFIDFVHPEDVEKTLLELEKMNQGEDSTNFENRYRKKDGQYILISWKARVDSENELFYATARDITKLKSEQLKFKSFYDALQKYSITAMTDKAGKIIDVNDEFCRISQYSRDELLGQNHRMLKSGAHSPDFYKEMWQTISSGEAWTGLIENRAKDGSHYFVDSILFPFINSIGETTNYMSIRFNVTDHIKDKSKLRKTLGVLNETGAIAKVGGWELDIATGELNWTDETFNILEVEKRHGQKPMLDEGLQLFTDRHQPIIEEAVNRAIEYGEPYSLELEAQTAKGNVLWVYTNGRPYYVDGKVVTLSGTIQDIHEMKLARESLEQERIKSMQQSRLASLGEISAGVAHEINNPLTIIVCNLPILAKNKDNPEILSKKIESIRKSCERIEKIVGGLKRFVRSEGDHVKNKHFLNNIIEEISELAEIKAKKFSVESTYHNPADIEVFCDNIEIEQVLINIINNAIDAVKDQPTKKVEVKTYEEQDFAIIEISDSGPGIPDELKEKLFDPFFTTKPVGQGTGLGLSIAKKIIDEHAGDLYNTKISGKNCFVVKLPKA